MLRPWAYGPLLRKNPFTGVFAYLSLRLVSRRSPLPTKRVLAVKSRQIPIRNTLPWHFDVASVVTGNVVVHGVGANLVAPHAAARFVPALPGDRVVLHFPKVLGYALTQRSPSIAPVGVLATFGRLDADACRTVCQHHAGLGLVAMLPTGSRVLGKPHLNVFFVDFVGNGFGRVAHHHGNGGRMHAAFTLRGWHALPAVATAFLVELVKGMFVFRPNFGEESAGLRAQNGPGPALRKGVFLVELGLDADEQFGVVSAFGRADFNMTGWGCVLGFHDV